MSAYIVSNNHIDVIVSWFLNNYKDSQLWYEINGQYGYMDSEQAPKVAYELYKQNVRSVNRRYNDSETDELYQFTEVKNAKQAYSLAEIAGALDCLEYQSCETDDYHQTDAYKIITSMRKHLLKKIQADELGDNTTWSIDELKDKPAKYRVNEIDTSIWTD